MSAFDGNGRVGLWVNSTANLGRLPKIATVFGGMFTDVFVPRASIKKDLEAIRATKRPDGTFLRAHLHAVPGPLASDEFAALVHEDISRTLPGVVELNIEENPTVGRTGADYTRYIAEVLEALHQTDPFMRFRVNIAPYKAKFLPTELIGSVPQFYVAEQTYYGDMSRVSEAEAFADLIDYGVPRERASVCYGAQDEHRDRLVLPSLFYKGQQVRKLDSGIVFSDDLLGELNLI